MMSRSGRQRYNRNWRIAVEMSASIRANEIALKQREQELQEFEQLIREMVRIIFSR